MGSKKNVSISREKKEDGRVVRENLATKETTIKNNGETLKIAEREIKVGASLDRSQPVVKKITKNFLETQDSLYGTSLSRKLEPQPELEEEKLGGKQQRERPQDLGRAKLLVDKLTLRYCQNRNYMEKVEKLAKVTSRMSAESMESLFMQIMRRAESPYIALFLFPYLATEELFLSNKCVKQLSLLVKSFRQIYTETIPYSSIVWSLFKTKVKYDVRIETSFGLVGELNQTPEMREAIVGLYGKGHVVAYYKEVAAGILLQAYDRKVIYSLMYTINDRNLAMKPLEPMFAKLQEYASGNTVEKNTASIARAIWALLLAHPDAFDDDFGSTVTYFTYFANVFTEEACETFAADEITDIIDAIASLANAIINRTITSKTGPMDAEKVSNRVEKRTVQEQGHVQIIPEMEDVEYTDQVEGNSDSSSASAQLGEQDLSSGSGDHLNNVTMDPQRHLVFASALEHLYKTTAKNIKASSEWKKRVSYDSLLYLVAQIKLGHLVVYLSHAAAVNTIPYAQYFELVSQVAVPTKDQNEEKHPDLNILKETVMAEKWKTIGYLARESVARPEPGLLANDILGLRAPIGLISNIAAVVDIFEMPSISAFLTNGYIYDAIFLITLPKYVKNPQFACSLKECVGILISQCHKEALALLARKLMELDGFYTEAEQKEGSKASRIPKDYIEAKPIVRETIASLFLTEIDLTAIHAAQLETKQLEKGQQGYDTFRVNMKEKKVLNPETQEEEYSIIEETVFKRLGTDKLKTHNSIKEFHKLSKTAQNIDTQRRKIIVSFLAKINDTPISDKFVNALIALPAAVSLTDKFMAFLLAILSYFKKNVTLSSETNQNLLKFASKQMAASNNEIKAQAKFLYCDCSAAPDIALETDLTTFDGLSLSLLTLIFSQKGNIQELKDAFFRVCTEITSDERAELLLLFAKVGVPISNDLKQESRLVQEYQKSTQRFNNSFPEII
ncbi:hypothetical protein NEHOM01_0243 [Nematocida homosporus]|uniref:uncharacterized protein n=1 Tax=Nematocida homosporus TaxID=1912981 RepID=UPI002220E9F6|nr:uncharacterized protein NEHOM01_0243 [Nematocida homosporus]KAI5184568.1 hypothetical protein NEHOM01_0243 [Nematocida homosporus]